MLGMDEVLSAQALDNALLAKVHSVTLKENGKRVLRDNVPQSYSYEFKTILMGTNCVVSIFVKCGIPVSCMAIGTMTYFLLLFFYFFHLRRWGLYKNTYIIRRLIKEMIYFELLTIYFPMLAGGEVLTKVVKHIL